MRRQAQLRSISRTEQICNDNNAITGKCYLIIFYQYARISPFIKGVVSAELAL